MASTYKLIASQVLASSAASVTFSSIPSTYTDLVVRFSVRNTSTGTFNGGLQLQVNGVTSSVYSATQLYGNGSTGTSWRASSSTSSNIDFAIDSSGAASNTFTSEELYIPNYTSTVNKQISNFAAGEDNATLAYLSVAASLIQVTSAITSLKIMDSSGNGLATNSSFYLYGI